MGGFGRVENEELKRMQATFERLVSPEEVRKVYEGALKEVGRVHLASCVRNTPFGIYPSTVSFLANKGTKNERSVSFKVTPKLGGTLKKGWVANRQVAEASKGVPTMPEIDAKVNNTRVYSTGKNMQMTFFNSVKYAVYVDKGHRVCRPAGNQIGWVAPQNFIRRSEEQTAQKMPKIVTRRITKHLEQMGN